MHFDRAGKATEAVKYSLLAAGFAEQSGAIPEAIMHLSIARRNQTGGEFASEILWRLGHLMRAEVTFWGSVATTLLTVATLIILIAQ